MPETSPTFTSTWRCAHCCGPCSASTRVSFISTRMLVPAAMTWIAPTPTAAPQLQAEELQSYCAAIEALRRSIDSPHAYPGSPWLAAQLLRAQDRGLCCELLPAECRALERTLGGMRRMRVECLDRK